jgi:GntP family gluconate:H+ symporter
MDENIRLIIILGAAVLFIIWGTARLKLHPFITLLLAAWFAALGAGMPVAGIAPAITTGFGGLMSGIGLIIVLGTLLGVVLEKSGAAIKLAEIILRLVGRRYPALAMSLTGYIVSIPVFCDSAFIILSSVRKSLAERTGRPAAGLAIALATGLYATHTLVPPTPGPVAAAGNLGMENQLGMVIAAGLPVAFIAMLAGYFMSLRIKPGPLDGTILQSAEMKDPESRPLPAGWKALMPLLLPIALIGIRSFVVLSGGNTQDGLLFSLIDFSGQPVNALAIGLLSSLTLFVQFNKETLTGWVSEGIVAAAPVLLITGAGGSFGHILKEAQIADALGQLLTPYRLGIFLPFVVAAVFKTAQGSSTVALVAGSALTAPLLESLGLGSAWGATLAVLATGAGAMVVSHANDSYFWVVTQFSGIDPAKGYRTLTLTTMVQGAAAMGVVWILSLFFL